METNHLLQVAVAANPTGEHCTGCHAPSYFVPGYLYTEVSTGLKRFTVARQTMHATGCTSLSLAQN